MVRISVRCLRVSSDLSSPDVEGADNREVSPCVIKVVVSG